MPISRITDVPPGSQDLLFEEARLRRRVQEQWFERAARHGYAEVIPPTFEYEEVFTRGAGSALAARLIRFLDRDGALVALRADFTSALARVAASRLRSAPLPLRLCYAGKVYRQEPEGGGRLREVFQLGAELIGDAGAAADVEILRLVIGTLHGLGTRDFQINLGEIGFLRPVLAAVDRAVLPDLRLAIDYKDAASLARIAREASDPNAAATLAQLAGLTGRSEVLARARALAGCAEAREAVARLERIDQLLSDEERDHVVYDLGEIRGLDYYTGIQFEVFVSGVGRAVGLGGRYDDLLALYGAARPAVGFALETDALAAILAKSS